MALTTFLASGSGLPSSGNAATAIWSCLSKIRTDVDGFEHLRFMRTKLNKNFGKINCHYVTLSCSLPFRESAEREIGNSSNSQKVQIRLFLR